MARDCLDLPRLRRLVENWPQDGWQSQNTAAAYRYALLRSVATGRFIRYVEGGNA
jgi:asparagine synthase (glutamine-hydrolysing)